MKLNRLSGILIFLLCIANFKGWAQIDSPDFYRTDTIHEIRINFSNPRYLEELQSNYDNFHENDSNVSTMANIEIDGNKIDSVGINLKGNFSYSIPGKKKPIKVDFNEFVKNKRFNGLRALNLSNEFPDPSMLRNTVAFKILRDAGIITPRTTFARVFLNSQYYGLYVVIEQIDKSFISNHFESTDGELIKGVAGTFHYTGDDSAAFYRGYVIKSKNSVESWNRLKEFVEKVNTTPGTVFLDSIKSYFEFESFIPVLAANFILNNWDSYLFGQNYYLYRNPIENKYYYLPWDYNVSMNNYDVSGGDFDVLPGGNNAHFFNLPLPQKIFQNDSLRKKYLDALCMINGLLSDDSIMQQVIKFQNLIKPAMREDTYKAMSMDEFDRSLYDTVSISEIPFVGLITFLKYRPKQVREMLKGAGVGCPVVSPKSVVRSPNNKK